MSRETALNKIRRLSDESRKGWDKMAGQILSSEEELDGFLDKLRSKETGTAAEPPPLGVFLLGVAVGMRIGGNTFAEDA